MNLPVGAWPLIWVAVAIFLLPAVATGIRLQRVPFMMVEYVAIVLLFLLLGAMRNGGHSTLEKADLCTPPVSAQPRAPQPTANLAGCPGYSAPVIDVVHDIPISPAPQPVEK